MKKLTAQPIDLLEPSGSVHETIQKFFDLGIENFNRRRYRLAIDYFSMAIANDPQNSMAHYYRGTAKIYSRDSQGAIDDLTRAVEIPLSIKELHLGDNAILP